MKRLNETGPYWIDADDQDPRFPPVSETLRQPDGLLALGGDLSSERLLLAYRSGIFPWYGPGQPILWWSPDPRLVLFPEKLKVSRSLAKVLRNRPFTVTLDRAFASVIAECAAARPGQSGTWITDEMRAAYLQLHHLGHAHSVECWLDGALVGGLYGVAIGRVFFGESMFARETNASKVAFVRLARQLQQWGFPLIDCQVYTRHLVSLGAEPVSRADFVAMLTTHCARESVRGAWLLDQPGGI